MPTMPRVLHVVGTRPNFTKIASLIPALREHPAIEQRLVHTGQHSDDAMSRVFFEELALPHPNHDLACQGGSHATQTAAVMVGVERVLEAERPDLVVVVGDVNSTLAAALAAAKLGVPVAHVEAGLRAFDMTMPEEINRILTDRLSSVLLATGPDSAAQLRREGLRDAAIVEAGDLAIDTLLAHRSRAPWPDVAARLGIVEGRYGVLTLHRPAVVDDPERLRHVLERLRAVTAHVPLLFPVHPRTARRLAAAGLDPAAFGVRPIGPLSYLSFLAVMDHATCVLTDSGGIQSETTALGVPCFTLRDNTERPGTLGDGTNTLVMADARGLAAAFEALRRDGVRRGPLPALWDGRAGERSAAAIAAFLSARDHAPAAEERVDPAVSA
jgi:UDP-N-acetylglucosamine 2-epimerase (non-hydrolysing)